MFTESVRLHRSPAETCGTIISLILDLVMKNFNKYQLQQELKKALHNRKQDNGKYLFYEDYISIEYNDQYDWIYSDWKGYQTENSIMAGCEKLLEACQTFNCSKLLNDNTNVVGIWTPASAWVGNNWIPRVMNAGVKYFAWVYSSSAMSRVSTDESIKNASEPQFIHVFEDIEAAKKWLTNKR